MLENRLNSLPPEELLIPDSQIILASKENPERFGEIVARYHDRLSGFFVNRMQNIEDAKDLTQATWMKAYVGLQNYQDKGVSFDKWLFAIAFNNWRNWNRDRKGVSVLDTSNIKEKSKDGNPDSDVLKAEERAKVRRVLGEMPVDQGFALWAHVVDDKKFQEIGDWMGRTEGAVKALVHRGRESFKKIYMGIEEATI